MTNSDQFDEIADLSGYEKICYKNDIKEKEGQRYFINNVEIAVFKVDGEIFVLNNICPHQHSALIYDGFIENGCVVCPAHGWMFDLRSGKLLSGGKGLDIYPVHIKDGMIYSKITEKKFNW